MMLKILFVLSVLGYWAACQRLPRLDNGLGAELNVYKPKAEKYIRKCEIKGKPLDLMFIVDSSGSVGPQWDQTLQMLKDIVNFVTVAPDGSATRISFLLYANRANNIFDFNTHFRREDILERIGNIRPINGVTKTGRAFAKSLEYWTEERGMRGPTVPKVAFLFSDGRASDSPRDVVNAKLLRDRGIDIYAFGFGEYLDWTPLTAIVGDLAMDKTSPNYKTPCNERTQNFILGGDPKRIASSRNATAIFDWFLPWKGIEICEEVPACVPGSDKPLDLLFVVDTSSSVEEAFQESVNYVTSLLNYIHVHPQAVQVAMITYGSRPSREFAFNKYKTNEEVVHALAKITPQFGTTQTGDALKMASETFDAEYGARTDEKTRRLAVVLTDGHSTRSPAVWAKRLHGLKGVDVFAVGLKSIVDSIDYNELRELVGYGNEDRVFISGRNLVNLPTYLLNYADLMCPGLETIDGQALTAADAVRETRGPIQAKCTPKGMVINVRTRQNFNGVMFAVGYDHEIDCQEHGQDTTQTQVIIKRGSCGMKVTPTLNGQGYEYSVRLGFRFHELVFTTSDDSADVNCVVNEPYDPRVDDALADAQTGIDFNSILNVATVGDANCEYRLTEQGRECELLDAYVGKVVKHEWTCAMPHGHRFLVHDCIAETDVSTDPVLKLLSGEGCETDKVLLRSPRYDKDVPNEVSQRSQIFKFPRGSSVRFKCLVSICDMGGVRECKYMFDRTNVAPPLNCKNQGPLYQAQLVDKVPIDYAKPPQNDKFAKTLSVTTRTINVYNPVTLTKIIKPKSSQFCSSLR